MLIWIYFMLTCSAVWAFPEKRKALKEPQSLEHMQNSTVTKLHKLVQRKCGAEIAQKAAAEAKAAHAAQNAAGAQAAHMVKTQLAEKALQAAKAAQAALTGKQAVIRQLRQEVKEAQAVVAEYTAAVRQQQETVNAASTAQQQAAVLQKVMIQATNLACGLEKSVQCLLEKVKTGLHEKCHNLVEARARLAQLQHKLQCACADCAATKQAANCACEAARAACGNARKKRHNKNIDVDSENTIERIR